MKPEDVPQDWVLLFQRIYSEQRRAIYEPTVADDPTCFRHALAVVLPLAVAQEREAIAQLCKQKANHYENGIPDNYDEMSFDGQHAAESYGSMYTAHELARAIRSRGEPR